MPAEEPAQPSRTSLAARRGCNAKEVTEAREYSALPALLGDESEPVAGRAPDELRELEFEP